MLRRKAGGRVLRKRRKRAAPRTVSPTPTSSRASTNWIRLSSEYRRGFPAPTGSAISGRTTRFSAPSMTCRGRSPTLAHTAAREYPRGGIYVPVYSCLRLSVNESLSRKIFLSLPPMRELSFADLSYVSRRKVRGGVRNEAACIGSFGSPAREFEDAPLTPAPPTDQPMTPLLTPEIVLQSQFLNERASPVRFSGEYRLALAILHDAIQIYCMEGSGRRNLQLRREAARWLHSDDRSWCFSFERICETLELEPDCVRRGLRAPGMRRATALWSPVSEKGDEHRRAGGV